MKLRFSAHSFSSEIFSRTPWNLVTQLKNDQSLLVIFILLILKLHTPAHPYRMVLKLLNYFTFLSQNSTTKELDTYYFSRRHKHIFSPKEVKWFTPNKWTSLERLLLSYTPNNIRVILRGRPIWGWLNLLVFLHSAKRTDGSPLWPSNDSQIRRNIGLWKSSSWS